MTGSHAVALVVGAEHELSFGITENLGHALGRNIELGLVEEQDDEPRLAKTGNVRVCPSTVIVPASGATLARD